jgi:hypothetical protein
LDGNIVDAINAYEQWMNEAPELQAKDKESITGKDSPVVVTEVAVEASDGGERERYLHDEGLAIKVRYHAFETINEPNFVVRITRSDGLTSCMVRTKEYGIQLEPLQGEGQLTLVLDPLQLNGGSYSVDVRVLGLLDGIPLAEGHSMWFQVKGLDLSVDPTFGVFVPTVTAAWIENRDPGSGQIVEEAIKL